MKAFSKILAGGVAMAALASAAPAAAQYYPGYGYGNSGGIVGQVINQVLGGGQYGYNYGNNSQHLVQRCAAAVEQRINRDYNRAGYGSYGYGGYGGYGYNSNAYGSARVLGISSVERRSSSTYRVRGVASANGQVAYGGYGGYGGYNGYGYAQPTGELSFRCDIDYRGYVRDIDLDRNSYAYSPYGYRR